MSDKQIYYSILIRRNSDGVERLYNDSIDSWFWDDHDGVGDYAWMWLEGNYSCDCNRSLFFSEAAKESKNYDDCKCGHDKFTCVKVILPDGRERLLDGHPDAEFHFPDKA